MCKHSSKSIRTLRAALAVIWLCSLGGNTVGITAAQAADPDPEAGRKIQFAIPAQSLSSALLQFSEASQVKVFFNADVVRNLKSKDLRGPFTPQAALQQLLAGSGLVHRYTSTGSVTIEPPASADPLERLVAEAGNMEYAGVHGARDEEAPSAG